MPSLNITPAESALVLIDLQKGISARPGLAPRSGQAVIAQAAQLAARFRSIGALVVPVHVFFRDGKDMPTPEADAPGFSRGAQFPPDFAEFVPELEIAPTDLVIAKRQWGAFYGTELDLQLRRRGVKTIVLGGIATNMGVESTARDAFERGYNQLFVEDAMASFSAEAHDFSIRNIFPRIGKIVSTQAVLDALE